MHETETQRGMPIRTATIENEVYALGLAVRLLLPCREFANLRFGNWAGMLAGQIARRHYLFAFRGETVTGYVGWGETSQAVADAWLGQHRVPAHEECLGGDALVLFTWCARQRDTRQALLRGLVRAAPEARRLGWLRIYPDGRIRPVSLNVSESTRRRLQKWDDDPQERSGR